MLEGKEIIGMPVVTSDTGEEIGRVKEVIVHRAKKCVVGFLLQRSGWFQHARAVPFAEVESFDKSAVMVPSTDSVVRLEQVPEGPRLLERKPIAGSALISRSGHEVGRVTDFFFDEDSGEFDGFEVVAGSAEESADDEVSSPEYLPLNDDVFVGKDDVVISEQAVERLFDDSTESDRRDSTREIPVMDENTLKAMNVNPAANTAWKPADPIVSPIPGPVLSPMDSPILTPTHEFKPVSPPNEFKPAPASAPSPSISFPLPLPNPAPNPIVNPFAGPAAKPLSHASPLKITRDGSSIVVGFNTRDIPDDLCIAGYHKQLLELLAENEDCTKLTFDVKDIKFLPSSMLGLLASLRKKVGNLVILHPSHAACEALKILGFDKYITIINDD
jgi:uncharacterized protein YrrD